MPAEQQFVRLASLICEPTRAKMLWNLLDGKAYTATELSQLTDATPTAASNHLGKLLQSNIIKVENQGRHRYFSIARPEVAYAIESLATLVVKSASKSKEPADPTGIRYCRTCYDHLAGFVGVQITEGLEVNGYLIKEGKGYRVTDAGWKWAKQIAIYEQQFSGSRRLLTRQCLDWSERRPHLAGALGAALLQYGLKEHWFRRKKEGRELVVTAKGSKEIYRLLRISI